MLNMRLGLLRASAAIEASKQASARFLRLLSRKEGTSERASGPVGRSVYGPPAEPARPSVRPPNKHMGMSGWQQLEWP